MKLLQFFNFIYSIFTFNFEIFIKNKTEKIIIFIYIKKEMIIPFYHFQK
jgi:hypothetical protein